MKQDNCEYIIGTPVTIRSKDNCVCEIVRWIDDSKGVKYFVCANPHSLEVARKDKVFYKALGEADLIVPDGIGIVLASRMALGKIRERITGMDIFYGLSSHLNQAKGYKYFFLGSTESNLAKIKERMRHDFPNIPVVGTYSPPFKKNFIEADNERMIEAVNRVKPDVLWIGMTAPKQEKWIYQNKDKLDVKFIGAIGAVFDFYAGTVKRPHPWFQKHGLEWLPRLIGEPSRLWQRNLVSSPKFVARLLKEYIMNKIGIRNTD